MHFAVDGDKYITATNAVTYMVVRENLPLSFVESDGLTTAFKAILPLYKLPSRRAFTTQIDFKYKAMAEDFKIELRKADHVTITTDIWTETKNTKSFLGITVHFLADSKLKTATIGRHMISGLSFILITNNIKQQLHNLISHIVCIVLTKLQTLALICYM